MRCTHTQSSVSSSEMTVLSSAEDSRKQIKACRTPCADRCYCLDRSTQSNKALVQPRQVVPSVKRTASFPRPIISTHSLLTLADQQSCCNESFSAADTSVHQVWQEHKGGAARAYSGSTCTTGKVAFCVIIYQYSDKNCRGSSITVGTTDCIKCPGFPDGKYSLSVILQPQGRKAEETNLLKQKQSTTPTEITREQAPGSVCFYTRKGGRRPKQQQLSPHL